MERGRRADGLRLGERVNYVCLECGKKFRTVRSAMSAAMRGCPRCHGVDIDLDNSDLRSWASSAADAVEGRRAA